MLLLEMEFKPKFIEYSKEDSFLRNLEELFEKHSIQYVDLSFLIKLLTRHYQVKYNLLNFDPYEFTTFVINELNLLSEMGIVTILISSLVDEDSEVSEMIIGLKIANSIRRDSKSPPSQLYKSSFRS